MVTFQVFLYLVYKQLNFFSATTTSFATVTLEFPFSFHSKCEQLKTASYKYLPKLRKKQTQKVAIKSECSTKYLNCYLNFIPKIKTYIVWQEWRSLNFGLLPAIQADTTFATSAKLFQYWALYTVDQQFRHGLYVLSLHEFCNCSCLQAWEPVTVCKDTFSISVILHI